MKIFLDSANREDVRKVKSNSLVDGVTTNPKLVRRAIENSEVQNLDTFFKELLDLSRGKFFIQVENSESRSIVKQARKFAGLNQDRVVIKLPPNDNGLEAINELNRDNISTCVTALFSSTQAFLASERGADYVAFYYDRFSKSGGNSGKRLNRISRILEKTEKNTKIVVGSLKNSEQVASSILNGADIVTLPLNLINSLSYHKLSEKAFSQFSEDWDRIKDIS